MNNPNPLVPQGALERQAKGWSTVHITILTIVSIHAVFFAGLLMQGCRRDDAKTAVQTAETDTNQNTLPPLEDDYYSAQPSAQDTFQPTTQEPTPIPAPIPSPAQPTPAPVEFALSTPQPSSEGSFGGRTYTIGKGDTLAKIARANGVSLMALTRANPDVNPTRLKLGSTIQIPSSTGTQTPSIGFAEPKSAPVTAGSEVHRVRSGETLTKIARRYGTTVKALKAANNMKSDRVLVGQQLKIPARASEAPGSRAEAR